MNAYYPFQRSARTSTKYNGDGVNKTYGPFGFPVADVLDVEVWRKQAGEAVYSLFGGAVVAKTTGDMLSPFTVTFPAVVPLSTQFFVQSRRLHERSTGIRKANQIDVEALDLELTRLGMIQQEHYREIGRAVRGEPGVTPPVLTEVIPEGYTVEAGAGGKSWKKGPSAADIRAAQAAANAAVAQAQAAVAQAQALRDEVERLADTVLDASQLSEALKPTIHLFSGDGVATDFDLGNDQIDERTTAVFIHGVYQQKNTYSVSAGILSFDQPPPAGTGNIEVTVTASVSITYAITTLPENTVAIELVDTLPPIGNYEGRTVYLKPENKFYFYDGADWQAFGVGGGGELPAGVTFLEIKATLPVSDNFTGRFVYQTSDHKAYLYNGTDWVPLAGSGSGGPGEIPEGGTYFEIVNSLPASDNFEGRIVYLTTEGRVYTFTGGEWKPLVDIDDVGFPPGFTAIQIVSVLPATDNFVGRMVYLTTDFKLYRYDGSQWVKGIDAEDILGQIEGTQISDDAITSPKIAAGAIVAGKLAANAVLADNIAAGQIITGKLAAGAVTSEKVAANAIVADKIAAGAVTAAKVSVTSLAALSATLGAVNIQSAVLGSLQVDTINIAGNAVTVQAGAETAGNVTVGSGGFTIIQSVAITWGTAAIWVFTQFRCTTAEDVEIDIRNNGVSVLGSPFSVRAAADNMVQIFKLLPVGTISGSGTIGIWARNAGSGSITLRNRGLGVLAAKR